MLRPEIIVWNHGTKDPYVKLIAELGLPIHLLDGNSNRSKRVFQIRKIIREKGPGIVHSYSFYLNFVAYCATLGTDSVAIGSIRNSFAWEKTMGSPPHMGELCARWPRSQICNSLAAANEAMHAKGPFKPKRIIVVRNGMDLRDFPLTPLEPAKRPMIVGIGSLLPRKRWDRILEACAILNNNLHKFSLRIVGEGPMCERLLELAERYGIADVVHFEGYSNSIPEIMAKSDFLVHASDHEGCPNVVMEAMACGRPVIAMSVGDIPSLIDDGKTGYVVPVGNVAMLAERMSTLIRYGEIRCLMGNAGRAKAIREFGVDRLVSETLAAYGRSGWELSAG